MRQLYSSAPFASELENKRINSPAIIKDASLYLFAVFTTLFPITLNALIFILEPTYDMR
jgi:hypothetical protein